MASYPVIFDIQQQEKYDRVHIAIRLLIVVIMAIIGGALGWTYGLLYLAVPVLAAILIAQKGASRYFAEAESNMVLWLRWIAAFYSYLFLLTDRLPNQDPKETLRFEVTPQGEPTAGGVLLRIILAIPHAIVLAILGVVAFVLMIIAAIMILVQEMYPAGIFAFIRADMRWNARVYGYLAGFAQEYPPFALDTGPEGGAAVGVGVAPPPAQPGAGSGTTP
jgi:Domain of unknown function (DUF4389)